MEGVDLYTLEQTDGRTEFQLVCLGKYKHSHRDGACYMKTTFFFLCSLNILCSDQISLEMKPVEAGMVI
jgi:hypothetical protein